MTNQQAKDLFDTLSRLDTAKLEVDMSWAVVQNSTKIQEKLLVPLQKLSTPTSQSHLEYEERRLALCSNYALKVNGRPHIDNGNFMIDPEKAESFNIELEALRVQYPEGFAESQAQAEKIGAILDKTFEDELIPIKKSWLPKTIAPCHLRTLMPIVEI